MKKLNLHELEAELEVIGREETSTIKGGYYDDIAFSVMGDEVIINGQRISRWDNSDLFNVYARGDGWYIGGGTWGDYNGGGAGCPIEKEKKITRNSNIPLTQEDWYIALTMVGTALDTVWSGSEALTRINNAVLPAWFRATGRGFALLGLADNLAQLSVEGINMEDTTQLAIGTVLVGFSATLGAPVVFVAGAGLMVWEMYEQYGRD